MPSSDWYWNQYQLEQQGGQLDITNDSWLQEQDLSRSERDELETKFIDELYGTIDAQWTGDKLPYDSNTGGPTGGGRLHRAGDTRRGYTFAPDTWGLDIARTMIDEDGNEVKIGDSDYYEHLTRGEVDWAYYEESNKYQEAYQILKDSADTKWDWLDNYSDLKDMLTDRSDDNEAADWQKIEFIRGANESLGRQAPETGDWRDDYDWDRHPDNPDSFWNSWDNKFVQPEVKDLTGWKPSYLDVSGRNVGEISTDIATKSEFGELSYTAQDAAAEAGIKIKDVQLQAPANLPKGEDI